MMREEPLSDNFDIIIVGAGGAGMCAALEAHAAGLRPLILEADDKTGGATALSSGVYYAAGTSRQAHKGIVDSADAMYSFIITLSQAAVRPDILRTLCDRASEGLDFLVDNGATFPMDYVFGGGRDRVARGHSCSGEGGSIAAVLAERVREKGIGIRLNTRVEALMVEAGRIVGVRAGTTEYRGDAVIMASGGFGNNMKLLERFWPSIAQHGERVRAVCAEAPYILGDGIVMGEAVGAAIVGHDTGLMLPTAGFTRGPEGAGAIAPWTILVNVEGRRFIAETAPYSVSGNLINAQTGSRCFAIFDEKSLTEVSDDIGYTDPHRQGVNVPSWCQSSVRKQIADGKVMQADTLAELAAKAGIAPRALEATVARYNADAERGVDGAYFKAAGLYAIATPPFYAVEMRAAVVGVTATGLDIDPQARVLDQDGVAIPGLYAAGEVLGSVFGTRYPAGGVSIAAAVVFGRIAGQTASADIVALRANRPADSARMAPDIR